MARGHLKQPCNGSDHSLVYLHLWKSAGFQLIQNLQSCLEQIPACVPHQTSGTQVLAATSRVCHSGIAEDILR